MMKKKKLGEKDGEERKGIGGRGAARRDPLEQLWSLGQGGSKDAFG